MSSKPDILMIDPMPKPITERLEQHFTLHPYEFVAKLGDLAAKIRGVTTGGGSGLPREILDALPNLGVISVNGVGTDKIDLEECKRRKIRVATTQGVLTDDVADMALALLLDTLRGVVASDRFVRAGRWGKDPVPNSYAVKGKKLGIAGFGHIGKAIASRAAAFGMEIAYFNSRKQDDSAYPFYPEFKSLVEWADVLVLAVSGGPRSYHMVNKEIIEALGPKGFLINVARGSVVDEDELLSALKEGRLGGAGLDVFAHEPSVPEGFYGLDNVVLQAHRASATIETRNAMGNLVIDNLIAFFDGKPLLTPVV
ncbi:2-hydroxyacid dehydrogenase [Kozakia baliensis]|uniref:2-hydroxyacid dehydrogenase n=1 Tax=Kozakia baliensis TaxID=153496 RepID=UPI00087DEF42|nr:2-hydroxyacid dehydrogenase [Kozakia baliensis]AOX20733.1 dihydrofolate reductase [Kozakia baliensis]